VDALSAARQPVCPNSAIASAIVVPQSVTVD
jgi:hypothetical protein